MCITSMVGDFRDWGPTWPPVDRPIPQKYAPIWEDIAPRIPTKKPEDLSLQDIESLIDVYLKALEYDIKNNEPNCHAKEKHEELEEISLLLTKRISRFVKQEKYSKAQEALNLKVRIDNLIKRLDDYACSH